MALEENGISNRQLSSIFNPPLAEIGLKWRNDEGERSFVMPFQGLKRMGSDYAVRFIRRAFGAQANGPCW
jgi:hypothetical protein